MDREDIIDVQASLNDSCELFRVLFCRLCITRDPVFSFVV